MGRLKLPSMISQDRQFSEQEGNFGEAWSNVPFMSPSREIAFWEAVNAVPIRAAETSSSEDDISSLGSWRGVSQRLDSDFESSDSDNEVSVGQTFSSEASTSLITEASTSNITKRTVPANKRESKPTPKLKALKSESTQRNSSPKPRKVQQNSPVHAFPCTYANCDRSYMSTRGLRKHLADHEDTTRIFLCVVCSQRFLRLQDLNSHLAHSHKGASTS